MKSKIQSVFGARSSVFQTCFGTPGFARQLADCQKHVLRDAATKTAAPQDERFCPLYLECKCPLALRTPRPHSGRLEGRAPGRRGLPGKAGTPSKPARTSSRRTKHGR